MFFKWLKLYIVPTWILISAIGLLALEMWAVGAIGLIFLLYTLIAQKDEYPFWGGAEPQGSWLQQVTEAFTLPSRLGLALLAAGASILVAAFAFGLTVGVGVAIAIWLALFGLWLAATYRRFRAGRQ
jgi:hypothetical protein